MAKIGKKAQGKKIPGKKMKWMTRHEVPGDSKKSRAVGGFVVNGRAQLPPFP